MVQSRVLESVKRDAATQPAGRAAVYERVVESADFLQREELRLADTLIRGLPSRDVRPAKR